MADHGYLNGREAAALLGVSTRTVTRWAREGRIATKRTPGGQRRFARHDVELLLLQELHTALFGGPRSVAGRPEEEA